MPKKAASFLRRTYKIIAVLVVAIAFFFFYNVYLVDRSLINLRVALNKAAQAQTIEDFEKIKPLIKTPVLNEISGKVTSSRSIMSAEMAENIIASPRKMEQVEDIKLCLKNMIEAREKERGGAVAVLNRVNSLIFAPSVKANVKKLNIWVMNLSSKMGSVTDRKALQELYYDLGNAYVQLSDINKAEESFLKAIEIDPKSDMGLKARFNLGWAYKHFEKYDKAVAVFEKLIKEFPETELAISSQYQIADTVYKKGDRKEARDIYAKLSGEYLKYENADMGLFQAGYISFYDLNDREAALKYFTLLKDRFPNSPVARHADDQTKAVIAHDYRSTGFELLKKGRYTDALHNFTKAVEHMPSDAGSLGGMGLALYWVNDKEEALNKAVRAFEISTRDETAYANSLYVYVKSGLVDEAIRKGDWILSKHNIKLPEFYYNLGCAYLLKKKIADAINMFKIAVKKNPYSVFANNNLGCGLWLISRYPEAIEIFRKTVGMDPNYIPARFNLGVAYFYTGELEKSYKEFKELLSISKSDSKVKEYMRRIEETLQYKPEA